MSTSSHAFEEGLADLLWSLWAEFGVSGVVPPWHRDHYVDPEALVLATAALGDLDPRLRDEAIDWVVRYGTQLSKARLKNLRAAWHVGDDEGFVRFAATVNAHAKLGWPAGGEPLPFTPRGHVRLDDLSRPSLLTLRTRAVFGIGARAEIIRVFLGDRHPMTAAALATDTSYGKRNVRNALETLRSAGLVDAVRVANADHFRLLKARAVIELVGPVPTVFPRWHRLLPLILRLRQSIRGAAGRSALEHALAARRFVETEGPALREAGSIPVLPAGPDAWPVFTEWSARWIRTVGRTDEG